MSNILALADAIAELRKQLTGYFDIEVSVSVSEYNAVGTTVRFKVWSMDLADSFSGDSLREAVDAAIAAKNARPTSEAQQFVTDASALAQPGEVKTDLVNKYVKARAVDGDKGEVLGVVTLQTETHLSVLDENNHVHLCEPNAIIVPLDQLSGRAFQFAVQHGVEPPPIDAEYEVGNVYDHLWEPAAPGAPACKHCDAAREQHVLQPNDPAVALELNLGPRPETPEPPTPEPLPPITGRMTRRIDLPPADEDVPF